MICDRCYQPLETGEHGHYKCPLEPRRAAPAVIDDSWANGKTFEHLAHEPVTFYSKSEYRAYLKQTGQMEFVRHVGKPGSDKSPHTTRWI